MPSSHRVRPSGHIPVSLLLPSDRLTTYRECAKRSGFGSLSAWARHLIDRGVRNHTRRVAYHREKVGDVPDPGAEDALSDRAIRALTGDEGGIHSG